MFGNHPYLAPGGPASSDAVALDTRDPDISHTSLSGSSPAGYGLPWLLLLGDCELGGDVERDAEHVSILDVEGFPSFRSWDWRRRAADHLFAEKLSADSAR